MFVKEILKIARDILALNKWVKVKDSQNGWKRQKPDGSFEYRYQDTDPNITSFKIDSKPTAEELHSLGIYTMVGYSTINKSLRGIKPATKQTEEKIKLISSMLEKLPDYKETVYRGMNLRYDKYVYTFLNSLKQGDVIKSKGFLSTTKDFDTANGFAGLTKETSVVFEISSKHGKDISKYTSFHGGDEQEVLFKPDSNFQVESVIKGQPLVIKLTEVRREPNKIPIKDMSPLGLKKALLRKKDLKEDELMFIESLSDSVLKRIIKKIINKHGPYYVI